MTEAPPLLSEERRAELKRVAEAATQGEWLSFDNREMNGAMWIGTEAFRSHAEFRPGCDEVEDRAFEDAAFCIAAQPSVVLSLLNHIEAVTRERDEAREGEARWMTRIADIREASGLGARPMLDELPDAIRSALSDRDAAVAEAIKALESVSAQAEHNSFVAAAIPADEPAMVQLGLAFVAIKDTVAATLHRLCGGRDDA